MKKIVGYEKGVNFGGWLSQCTEYTDSQDLFASLPEKYLFGE